MSNELMETEYSTPQLNDQIVKSSRKLLNMFFIVDVSGSMKIDGRIDAVNEAFTQMIPALREVQMKCMSEFEMRIAILTFDAHARWIVEPTPIMEFQFEKIEASKWTTYFSEAFDVFGSKLSRSAFMAYDGRRAVPYIMMMTDGEPTKKDDYQPALDRLNENAWFQNSQRFAVLIGQDTVNSPNARKAVAGFVSNEVEGIINAADACEIAANVQANTLKAIIDQTLHPMNVDTDPSLEDKGSSVTDTGNNGGLGDFGDFGSFGKDGGFGDGGGFGGDFGAPPSFDGEFI